MRYPYLKVRRRGEIRSLPIIQIRLKGPSNQIDVYGLVDSGAEQSVVNAELIDYLGVDTDLAIPMQIIGVGGQESSGLLADLDHQLGRHHWNAPVVFSSAVDSPIILVQAGFFEYFTVSFRRSHRAMEIRRDLRRQS